MGCLLQDSLTFCSTQSFYRRKLSSPLARRAKATATPNAVAAGYHGASFDGGRGGGRLFLRACSTVRNMKQAGSVRREALQFLYLKAVSSNALGLRSLMRVLPGATAGTSAALLTSADKGVEPDERHRS